MSSQSLLTGCGAVVSGGSRGIGRAVAELLGNLGEGVVVNGRDADAVRETVAAITAPGGQATSVVGAAHDQRVATTLIEECTKAYGRLDILINCAGIAEPTGSSILNISPEEFDRLISVHLGTTFHTCRIAARIMARSGTCGPDLRLPRQRLVARRDGSDLCCGRWIRRPLRSANAFGVGVSRSPRRRTVVGCGRAQDDQRSGTQAISTNRAGRYLEPIRARLRIQSVTSASLVSGCPPAEPLRVLVIGAGVSGISVARGLLRDGHEVTVFDQRTDTRAGGGAVTIWSNGETVLRQLGVDMQGAGQLLSSVQVMTSRGHRIATVDLAAMVKRLGAPVRMVPRRVLLERLLAGFPTHRIRCSSRAIRVATTANGVQVEFEDGSLVEGDLLIGADGLHSMVRDVVGAHTAEPTGWCSWQGLVTVPELPDREVALIVIGEHGNTGVWPAGGTAVQWWFDLPWSHGFVRPHRPIEVIRSNFTGWSDSVDLVLAKLTDEDLVGSPFPHFRHPIPQPLDTGAVTLLGDAAHTMPPTLAQGTNQALLDTMVLCRALSDFRTGANGNSADLSRALRWYENTRRRRVGAVSRVASLQVAHGESVLRPATLISDRLHTWALTTFLRWTSHRRMSAEINRDLGTPTPIPACHP